MFPQRFDAYHADVLGGTVLKTATNDKKRPVLGYNVIMYRHKLSFERAYFMEVLVGDCHKTRGNRQPFIAL